MMNTVNTQNSSGAEDFSAALMKRNNEAAGNILEKDG